MKYPPILQSSANPENLSLTIKGLLLGLVPTIILLSDSLGWGITQNSLSEWISVISQTLAYIFMIYGLMRKVILANKK